jgi:hypothetical protein
MRMPFLALLALTVTVAARAEEPQASPAPAAAPPAAAAPTPAAGSSTTAPAASAASATAADSVAPPAAAVGTLSLSSTPAGKVFLDGVDTGLQTPVSGLAVAAGPHTVKVVAEDGSAETAEFAMEAGGTLSLNLTLASTSTPAAAPATPAPTDGATPSGDSTAAPAAEAAAAPPAQTWTWMTVTGWSGLGLGTMGLLSGAAVMTTWTDPDRNTLGFGLFGGGVGLVLGGAVLLYLDHELAESAPPPATPAAGPSSGT